MPRRNLAWATDVHLDHLHDVAAIAAFAQALVADDPEAVLITGDISTAERLDVDLVALAEQLERPLYFTLGNHDFYGGGIAQVRAQVRELCAAHEPLRYLPALGVVELDPRTALVGVDGWGDARCGDWAGSPVRLSDFMRIADLVHDTRAQLVETLRALGDAEAVLARRLLEQALPRYSRVVVATHVPPFEAACWNEGEAPGPDDAWSPWFVCVAVGEVLLELAARHPHCRLEVYCGHSHGGGTAQLRDNLVVYTGEAEYGQPRLDRLIAIA